LRLLPGLGRACLWAGLGLFLIAGAASAGTEVRLSGQVHDLAGAPLSGVRVKAFVGGILRGSAVTDEEGRYGVGFSLEAPSDPSVVVWWLPAAPRQVPELLVLRESAQAKALRLWSPCLPRLELASEMSYDLTLRQEDEKLEELSGSDCLKGSETFNKE
jgi:hypothetical protein